MPTLVKIKVYKVHKCGVRGKSVALPPVWTDDLGLVPGDKLDVYRDVNDRLVIEAHKEPIPFDGGDAA